MGLGVNDREADHPWSSATQPPAGASPARPCAVPCRLGHCCAAAGAVPHCRCPPPPPHPAPSAELIELDEHSMPDPTVTISCDGILLTVGAAHRGEGEAAALMSAETFGCCLLVRIPCPTARDGETRPRSCLPVTRARADVAHAAY